MDRRLERERMVRTQIEQRGVRDPHLLAAMRTLPRESFVDAGMADFAYEDGPLPIGHGQTISQPYIVAAMVAAAAVAPSDAVLEIGAGSGYTAALLGRIAGRVDAIERHAALAQAAAERLHALGCDNVALHVGDGSGGWPAGAHYDAIVVSAGGPAIPQVLKDQLAVGGRLVMPVGERDRQDLVRVLRTGAASWDEDRLMPVAFVPLVGAHGWPGDALPSGPRR